MSHYISVLEPFIHTKRGSGNVGKISFIQLSLRLLFSFWKMASWQRARWQDLQICEMLLLIKTTQACGWAEHHASGLTAHRFNFLFSLWVLLTLLCLKENSHGTGLYYEIIIYMLNVIQQIWFATCWNWFRTQWSPPFYLRGAAMPAQCKGRPWRATCREKLCPWQHTSSSDIDVVLQHLTA